MMDIQHYLQTMNYTNYLLNKINHLKSVNNS